MELYNPFKAVSELATVSEPLRDRAAPDSFSPSLIVIFALFSDRASHLFDK